MPSQIGQHKLTSHGLVALAVVVSAVFVSYSNKRLWHSDLWAHLSYGRLICEERSLPEFEPFMPLARDVPIRCTASLSQVVAFQTLSACGHHGLQLLHGLAAAIASCFVFLTAWRGSRSWFWSIVGTLAFLIVASSQLAIIRPQLVGVACFPSVCLLARSDSFRLRHVVACAVLFLLWGNMHPSFPAGLIVLAAFSAEAFAQWKLVRREDVGRFRYLTLATFVAAVAVLANPYGWRIYEEVFAVSANPNLRDLLDWRPLSLARRQGQLAVIVGLVAATLVARSRERRLADIVLVLLAGAASVASARMLNWFAPLVGIVIGAYGPGMFARDTIESDESRFDARSIVVAAAILALALCLSPLLRVTGFRPSLTLEQTVSGTTPVEAVEFLNTRANGMTFAPNTWGDYLVWTNGGDVDVLVTSHVHLVPRELWKDYLAISSGTDDAVELLDQYAVNTVLVNPRRAKLVDVLEESSEWLVVFDNKRSRVYQRTSAQRKGTAD